MIRDLLGVAHEDRDSFQHQEENQLALDGPEQVMGQNRIGPTGSTRSPGWRRAHRSADTSVG
ncbi:hypothetical protein [Saccharothrix longispora]|uniref:hypothetical protein n=1 Tax=Saccharothrix longispora TaxID=33920 RepID=UPI002905E952|nr:hypothetical protein [Saccharothrix longispora]